MYGIIGGSGLYQFIDNPEKEKVATPFGDVIVDIGNVEGEKIVFIPRHGSGHSIPPSQINYRANIFAAHKLGIEKIFATNAVGSLNLEYIPGSFAVPDQILDFTSGRADTFFDGSQFEITTLKGNKLSGVVHTDMTHPFDQKVRGEIIAACEEYNENVIQGGTIAVVNGPRYETPAEIKSYSILGASFAGMTSAPEAFLAKEIELPYATMAVVTNFAAGLQSTISHDEVDKLFKEKINRVKSILTSLILS